MASIVRGENFPGVCTQHFMYGFGVQRALYTMSAAELSRYKAAYPNNPDVQAAETYDKATQAVMEADIKEHINTARKARKAIIQATTTANQDVGRAALEACGFSLVMDAEDVKYPDSSKRLYLWALDLNKKAEEKIVVKEAVNPFAQQQNPVAAPSVASVEVPEAEQAAPVRARLQNGQFMPAVGQEFDLDRTRPIPTHWREAGVRLHYIHLTDSRNYDGIVRNARWARERIASGSTNIPAVVRVRRLA